MLLSNKSLLLRGVNYSIKSCHKNRDKISIENHKQIKNRCPYLHTKSENRVTSQCRLPLELFVYQDDKNSDIGTSVR